MRRGLVLMTLTAAAVTVAGAGVASRVRAVREQGLRERCAAHLKQIGQAMLLYSVDNRNRHPDSFATLARFVLRDRPIDRARFLCPTTNAPAPAGDAADRGDYRLIADTMPASIEVAKYGYVRSGSMTAEQCAAIEVPGHHGGGVHVLHADGHVEFRQISVARGATWADTQDDVMRGRPVRWPASQPVR